MKQQGSTQPAAVIEQAEHLFCSGRRSQLLDTPFTNTVRAALAAAGSPQDVAHLRAILAYVALACRARSEYLPELERLVMPGDRGRVANMQAIRALVGNDSAPFLVGWWQLHVSRFLFLEGELVSAELEARNAIDALARLPEPTAFQLLLRCEAELLCARLLFLNGERESAEEMVGRSVALMGHHGAGDAVRGGFDAMLARLYSLWAYFDWWRGRYDEGRRKAYFALFLLNAPAADGLARASALFTASRLEAIDGSLTLGLQVRLLQESTELYAHIQHPFQWRTRVQCAQCYVKANQRERAREILAALEGDLPDGEDASHDLDDVRADIRLTRIWMHEQRGEWRDALSEATALHSARGSHALAGRLRVEATLHSGLSMSKLSPGSQPGRELLQEALRMAEEEQRERIQVRAHFALAETLEDWNEARRHYAIGSRLLSYQSGRFLSALRKELAAKFQLFVFDVDLGVAPRDAMRRFKEAYAEHALGDASNVSDIQDIMHVSRAQAYRILQQRARSKGRGES